MKTTIKIPASIAKLPVAGLKAKLAELGARPTNSRNRPYLQRLVARLLAEKAERDATPTPKKNRRTRINEICDGVNSGRITPRTSPTPAPASNRRQNTASTNASPTLPAPSAKEADPRLPAVGGTLERVFKGKTHKVTVLAGGVFSYAGKTYTSLSQIAKIISGTIWNGFLFFHLTPYPKHKKNVA